MTQNDWVKENEPFYYWYYENYEFLKDFVLPIEHSFLINYYIDDMKKRRLKYNNVIADNYEFVFSYFLDNYDKIDKFKGKSQLEYIIEAIPEGIIKTQKNISNAFTPLGVLINSLADYLPLLLIVSGLFVFYKIQK